ncbi:hypothetical protein K1719_009789 [Acacia pycnantha]|nr:hypothetical protein K1719_009789 [Acacia pycnantha]
MSIITWNCQGAFDKKFPSIFKSFVANYKADILLLLEPRISDAKADSVIKKLGFHNSHKVEASGFSRGIWILWSSNVTINILVNHVQFVHIEISWACLNLKFLFTAVYGSPQSQFWKFLWRDITQLADSFLAPRMLAGDFNTILHHNEHQGGYVRRAQGCGLFNAFIHLNGPLDLGSNGPKFTWRRGSLFMRLDRAICNPE